VLIEFDESSQAETLLQDADANIFDDSASYTIWLKAAYNT
jgi:hypothetical protein